MISVAMLSHIHTRLRSLLLENSFIIDSEKYWDFLRLDLVVFFFLVVELASWRDMCAARLRSVSAHASITLVTKISLAVPDWFHKHVDVILLSVVHVILWSNIFLRFLGLQFTKCLFVAFGSSLFAAAQILD